MLFEVYWYRNYKMNSKEVDYILVGQGLAGSCLALQFLFLDKKILVIDKQEDRTATKIAAGIFNPITGQKMVKTWMADELFYYLHGFYKRAEDYLHSKFFYPIPLYIPFTTIGEQNEWMGKSTDIEFSGYIDRVYTSPVQTEFVKNELGGLLLKQCGYVNTQEFSKAVCAMLKSKGALLPDDFDEELMTVGKGSVEYKGWQAKKIIYCTGEKILGSKFFSWLPIRPLKGETITIKAEKKMATIYNRGVYVVPGIWKVGATYNFNDRSPGITQAGRQELQEKLDQLVSFPYEIVDHQWGNRPTTRDRRPILGQHPEFEQFVIFNGLGTKGISLAPYFSDVLVSWMEKGHPLNNVVDVNRYKSVYWNPA